MVSAFKENLQVLLESLSIICEVSQTMMAYYQAKTWEIFGSHGRNSSLTKHEATRNAPSNQLSASLRTTAKHVVAGSNPSLDPLIHVPCPATTALPKDNMPHMSTDARMFPEEEFQ